MAQVTIICEQRKGRFPHFILMAPLKETSKAKIVAESKNSKTAESLYAYAAIHCVRLGLGHFWDENKKVFVNTVDTVDTGERRSAQMAPGTFK